MRLRAPVSGLPLAPDSPHSLSDGAARWPVVDGIPYLRAGREALAAAALASLDAGDRRGALVLLLADQDDWWRGPAAAPADLARLVDDAPVLTLRAAMGLLAWGPVADYFAHRWSDPTFLAGLALVRAHWSAPARAFELACGIGHHLRALAGQGVAVAGGDVVFAKLWVARHWVAPGADLVCFDAASPWPVEDAVHDLVACHDAFYFLEPKAEILARLRALRAPGGWLAVGHVHNRDWPNLSAGSAVTAAAMADLFPDAVAYDDAELTRALAEARAPRPAALAGLGGVEAFSVADGALSRPPGPASGGLAAPPPGALLRRNPLYGPDGALAWPSERYAREYGPRATYPARSAAPDRVALPGADPGAVRRRELVDLPERW